MHKAESWWFKFMDEFTTVRYENKDDALDAEREAVGLEKPKYNKNLKGNGWLGGEYPSQPLPSNWNMKKQPRTPKKPIRSTRSRRHNFREIG